MGDDLLLTAAHYLHATIGVGQNAWLDGAELLAVVDGANDFPCLTKIPCGFKMYPPTLVLGAGRAKDGAVGQLDWLIFHRTNQMTDLVVLSEFVAIPPSLASVLGGQKHTPPPAGRGTHLIEKHKRPFLWLK